MKAFFKEMMAYTFTFNNRVIVLYSPKNKISEKAFLLLNHTLNAHEVWNARIEEKPTGIAIWGARPLENLKEINTNNYQKSLHIIDAFDFEAIIKYTNSRGDVYQNSVKDILFHIINHSTYHRGQIATECKINGVEPLLTDYIFYKRDSL